MKKILFSLAVFSACISPVLALNFNPGSAQPGIVKNFEIRTHKKLTIGSNRASGEMHVNFIARKAGEVFITIQNESGEIVLKKKSQVIKKLNTIRVKEVLALPEGLYSVQLIADKETYTSQFIVWK